MDCINPVKEVHLSLSEFGVNFCFDLYDLILSINMATFYSFLHKIFYYRKIIVILYIIELIQIIIDLLSKLFQIQILNSQLVLEITISTV